MILFKRAIDLQNNLQKHRATGQTIGFVPTMGALHQGHLSLIEASRRLNDITVCSIFVNPTQFNDQSDFEKYPITIERDILLLEKERTDILFLPSTAEIYPGGTNALPQYSLGFLETILEGKYRPGHFQGVCQVIEQLLHIIQPNQLFLGQKDYQQCMVLTKLISLIQSPTQIQINPTHRESNGLAMSSRNMRLDEAGKTIAGQIYRTLQFIQQNRTVKPVSQLKKEAVNQLLDAGFEKVDYVEIANAATLAPLTQWDNHTSSVALIAAFLQGVRLIDNLLL